MTDTTSNMTDTTKIFAEYSSAPSFPFITRVLALQAVNKYFLVAG